MPSMPRSNKKATKIAYDILGTPPNMQGKKTKKPKKQLKENTLKP